jgi:hypothetical protein
VTTSGRRAKCAYCGRTFSVTPLGKMRKHRIKGANPKTPTASRPICGGSDRPA